MLNRLPIAIMAAVLVLLAILPGCDAAGPQVVIVAPDKSVRATIRVEIANTAQQRELGLMYRKQMDENAGMLFVFPAAEPLKFWMKNTFIPLDMIFADDSGAIVGIVANAVPLSEDQVGPDAPSRYVVEVNGGYSARHAIKPGDRLEFRGFTPQASQ